MRRLRGRLGLTQTRMAGELGVSTSYLNLIERNQRPLTAPFLLKLSETYNADLRELIAEGEEQVEREVAEILAGDGLADIDVGKAELQEFVAAQPGIAKAFVRLARQKGDVEPAATPGKGREPLDAVRAHIEGARNHFPELEEACEALADEMRLAGPHFLGSISDRLRVKHGFSVRILPSDVMGPLLRRFDIHNRQVQLTELLDNASRSFQVAYQLATFEMKALIDDLAGRAPMPSKPAEGLLRQTLTSYAAAAIMMPYRRFLEAAESTGYDVALLEARFGAGFEQVTHRLTTLQRPGARGVPFFLIRVDRAGNISKRFSAGSFPFARAGGTCPLWHLHRAFEARGQSLVQLVELEDGARFLTMSRTVRAYRQPFGQDAPEYALALGCETRHAHGLAWAQGIDLDGAAMPIGLGCRDCTRVGCPQRAVPPKGRQIFVDATRRGPNAFEFAND
ncbi:MAG: short-chain fatty acyl-CoA regulator family protein [Pacificimonas sp.]